MQTGPLSEEYIPRPGELPRLAGKLFSEKMWKIRKMDNLSCNKKRGIV